VLDLLHTAFGQQDHELIPTKARREIGAADGALETVGEAFKEEVSGGVSVFVIDLLQSVHIEEEKRERPAVAYRAADLLSEAQFAGATIVKSGELIEGCEFVHFICKCLNASQRFELVGDLVPHADNRGLLIDEIDAEKQHKTHERSHRLIQVESIGKILLVQERRKCKRSNRQSKQNEHQKGGGPQPPLAAVEFPQTLPEYLRVNSQKIF
jgi:hypothetical protein